MSSPRKPQQSIKLRKSFRCSPVTFHPYKWDGDLPGSHNNGRHNVRPRTDLTLSLWSKYILARDTLVASFQEWLGDDFLASLPAFGQDNLMRVLCFWYWLLCENIFTFVDLDVTEVHEMLCSVVTRVVWYLWFLFLDEDIWANLFFKHVIVFLKF